MSNATVKYTFTDEKMVFLGRTLTRIRRVSDQCLGGWLESESNLSQTGDAWVSDNAKVFGNASVSGDAQVFGNAWVYGDAQVFGNASVSDDAWVFGNASVSGDAQVFGNAWVYGDAQVFGDARVFGDAQVFGNAPDDNTPDDAPDDGNPKDVIGRKKPNLHLIPASANIIEAKVMELGAEKYGAFNWRSTKINASIYISAARRHLDRWFDGEDNDNESGLIHLAHARACLGILIDAIMCERANDDRPPAGPASKLIADFTRD
jgi:hypothetical protein